MAENRSGVQTASQIKPMVAPLRRIVRRHSHPWGLVEELECGHFNHLASSDHQYVGRNWRKGVLVRGRRCELCLTAEYEAFSAALNG